MTALDRYRWWAAHFRLVLPRVEEGRAFARDLFALLAAADAAIAEAQAPPPRAYAKGDRVVARLPERATVVRPEVVDGETHYEVRFDAESDTYATVPPAWLEPAPPGDVPDTEEV